MELSSIKNFSLERISFEQVYREPVVKPVFLASSVALGCINIPLCYGIIWYEQNNHYRTLINKLVASIIFYVVLWLLLTDVSAIVFVAAGPMGSVYCKLDIIAVNVIAMQAMSCLNGIMVAKYIFVFWIKNPLAVQEDFFAIFINVSSLMLK
jgi:hypothetical protein